MNRVCSMAGALLMSLVAVAGARAQEPVPRVRIPVEVEIVISRFEGDKRISSVPYVLAVNAASSLAEAPETSLNMGSEVPVPTTTFVPGTNFPGAPGPAPMRSFNYRSIGTSITGSAARAEGGLFELALAIDDTSIYTTGTAKSSEPVIAEMPVFRSFQTRNTLLLRDGQTRQFTAATDRISGETVRVDVTLRVVK